MNQSHLLEVAFLICAMMNINSVRNLAACLAVCLTIACGSESNSVELVELDLLSEGMPVVIKAPADPLIETKTLGVDRVMTVRKGQDFYLDIFEASAVNRDKTAIKSKLLREVQGHPYYQKIISDDDNGFIYETAVDSSYINYGFRYFLLQGDKEYIFQTGMSGQYSLESVQTMYDAVSQSK